MRVVLVFLLLTVAGCTYEAPVSATAVAATSIVPAKRSPHIASYFIAPELLELHGEAGAGPCTYPITVGPALVGSLESVTAAAFPAGAIRTDSESIAAGAVRHLRFSLDSFTLHAALDPGWFSVGASATVEMAVRVIVSDQTEQPIWNGLVQGTGLANGSSAGGCAEGSRVLTDAGNEAIRHLTEDYVAKVINSGQI